jgi:hypothetical protein
MSECFARLNKTGGGEPIQMAPGSPWRLIVLPFRGDHTAVGQPDEDRIERAGLQVCLFGDFVAVPPRRRIVQERGKHQ